MPDSSIQRRELHSAKPVRVNTQILSDPWVHGLLLEWRRIGDGPWEGLVVYVETMRTPRTVCHWSVRTEWVEVDRIRQR